MDKLEISEEAQVEYRQILNICVENSNNAPEYIKALKQELLNQIQLKINWNKAAQRQN